MLKLKTQYFWLFLAKVQRKILFLHNHSLQR